MSPYISAHLSVINETGLPKCHLINVGAGIPVVQWGDFIVSLGLLDDPATYLREWAHQLTALAHEVDQARDQHEPKGYDAPVPFVPTEGAYDERRASEVTQ